MYEGKKTERAKVKEKNGEVEASSEQLKGKIKTRKGNSAQYIIKERKKE